MKNIKYENIYQIDYDVLGEDKKQEAKNALSLNKSLAYCAGFLVCIVFIAMFVGFIYVALQLI